MPYLRSGLSTLSASAKTSSVVPPVWTQIYTPQYTDDFINSFVSRQVFVNRLSLSVSSFGNGFMTCTNSLGSYQLICYADAQKDKYPTYDNGFSYGIGSIVYGGYYGHGLFQRTGNPGNPGYPPIIGQVGGTQDSSGWTRYRPPSAMRLENDGDGIYMLFSLKPKSPIGASFNTGNTLRFGIFDSTIGSSDLPQYINSDNYGGVTNNLFAGYASGQGYRGYMATFSGNEFNSHFNYKRTTINSASLMGQLSDYTQLGVQAPTPMGFAPDQYRTVGIQVTRIGDTIEFLSDIADGGGGSSVNSTTDTNPSTYNFDVIAFHLISNVCTSFELTPLLFESFKYGFVYP